jgi:lipopolysaccharide transport system ATP-binding protein
MSFDHSPAIRVTNLSKCFQIYARPQDRLKQWIIPRLQRLVGVGPKTYFHDFWALHGVSLEIAQGKTIGIIGRNGSGKSTLLQLICGTLNPTTGHAEVRGRVAALLELGSGFNPEFTGRENVYMNASVLGLSKEQIDTRFSQIARFADIGEFISQPVKTYSSGMMVRLAFSVIAHVDADILIIDEALSVGDAFFTQKCMRFLRSFMGRGTILFVSHDTTSVLNLCDEVVWLDNGRVLERGVPKTVCGHYLEAFYETQVGQGVSARLGSEGSLDDVAIATEGRDKTKPDTPSSSMNSESTAESFGQGGGKITQVLLLDDKNSPLSWVTGGEQVTLRVIARVYQALDSPIVGFLVKDRLGQGLFGETIYLRDQVNPTEAIAGRQVQADFVFVMPVLGSGDYTITIALADGTAEAHVQHHWIHDAAAFRCESLRPVYGVLGISMLRTHVQVTEIEG